MRLLFGGNWIAHTEDVSIGDAGLSAWPYRDAYAQVGRIVIVTFQGLKELYGSIAVGKRPPLSDSVVSALRPHLDFRNQAGAPVSPDAALVWPSGRLFLISRLWSLEIAFSA